MKRLIARVLLFALLFTLPACGESPTTTVTVEPFETEPITVTTAVPLNVTLDSLYSHMSPDMAWSYLSEYVHTVSVPGNADFVVQHGDKTLSLHVLFDELNDKVTVADLTYGTTTVSLLTDDHSTMRTILKAVDGE